MKRSTATQPVLISLWVILVATALTTKPLMPVDETRYLAVAWEMWLRGDFLVPYLNGEPYSHKPPLLFWLIQAGWAVVGVSETWGRLVAPLFALGCLFLVPGIARRLWPWRDDVDRLVPLVLLGCAYWAVFTTVTYFDMLVTFFTLLAVTGVLDARERPVRGWVLAGIALGLGGLAKGPVILVHVLPVALLAPLWAGETRPRSWAVWYGGLAAAVVMGIGVTLAWALPAAAAGGETYGNAILWGQTAGRVSKSFAHQHPWWFYFWVAPAMLLPWLLLPTVWRGLGRVAAEWRTPGIAFCLAWFVPAFAVLSFVSGKQGHYLMPSLAAPALLIALALAVAATRRVDRIAAGIVFALPTIAFAILAVPGLIPLRGWVGTAVPLAGLPAALAAPVLGVLWARSPAGRAPFAAAAIVATVVGLHMALAPVLPRVFDLTPLAKHVARLQARGVQVANVHKYHGQYHFLGRLSLPVAITWQHEAHAWARANPGARMIVTHRTLSEGERPEFVQPYRNRILAVWTAEQVARSRKIVVP